MKFRNTLIIFTIVSIILAAWFFNAWLTQKQENTRINNNFSAAITEMKAENWNKNYVYQCSVDELKSNFKDIEKKLKQEFDVKLKNIKQYSQFTAEVDHGFKAPVKPIDWDKLSHSADSVIKAIAARGVSIDTIKLKTFKYKDAWLDFNAVEVEDTVYVDRNKTAVPLDQIVHRDKWKFKYLFKRRPLLQSIKSDNPYAEITFSRVIEISK